MRWLAVILWLALGSAFAQAQDNTQDGWIRLAERAEAVLERGRATDPELEQLRRDIADFRERFLEAQSVNQARIETLEAQISALGEAPADDAAPEAADIASRRAELEDQLARLRTPRRTAEEAYNRANGLVSEVDSILRERQAEQIRELGVSPLNPTHWPEAVEALRKTGHEVRAEINRTMTAARDRDAWRDGIPVAVFFLSIAVALVLRGRYWMEWLTLLVYAKAKARGNGAIAFTVSLGQVIVPVLGMLALREGLIATGLLGLRGQLLAEFLPSIGAILFGAMWLGARIFPRRDMIPAPILLTGQRRKEGRLYAAAVATIICLMALLERISEFDNYSDVAVSVLAFPLILLTGLILFRVGRILMSAQSRTAGEQDGDDREASFFTRILTLLGQVAAALGIVGIVLAVIGYYAAAKVTVFPTVASLALMGLLAVLHMLVRDLYALITGKDAQRTSEALTPTLISFALSIASVPLFALIWGARLTDLSELWARFREGFSVGDARISPTDFVTVAIVFAVGYGLTRLLQGVLKSSILPKTRMDIGGRTAITAGIGYVGFLLAGLLAITSAGIDLSSLALFAGALSVGIGFGLQNIVSNFVAGIILLIERPISEGDWIEVGGQMGYVRDISVRSTRIETFDRTDVIVPNADFVSGVVTNWTRGNLVGRVIVKVGVAYGSDTRQVAAILSEIAEAHPMVVLNPPPAILFQQFGADSLDFEIRAILRDVNFVLSVKSDMNHEITARFAEAGIEIPFAQRDIWLRNPEVLQNGTSSAPESG